MYKILAVDDEEEIRELLINYLTDAGYEVMTAANGVDAVAAFDEGQFDLVILDIMLPDIDGFGVCQLMRKKSAVPIIFLSAMDGEEQLVKGYDCLADDYVTKPFSMPILLRKIAAIFRRNDITDRKDDSQQITYKKLLIDRELMEVTVNGRKVNLTVREFNLLCLFAEHPGHVYSREMIIDSVWSYNDAVEDRVVDSHIKNLRQKIGGEYIETVRGIGYRAAK